MPEELEVETNMKLANKFKLGADPEFVFINSSGRLVPANLNSTARDIGQDGYLAELRPKPAMSAFQLTKNIKSLLTDPRLNNPKYLPFKWRAGAWWSGPIEGNSPSSRNNFSIGGHIHIASEGAAVTNIPKLKVPPKTRIEYTSSYPCDDPNCQDESCLNARAKLYPGDVYKQYLEATKQRKIDIKNLQKALDCGVRLLEKLDILPHKEMLQRRTVGYGTVRDAIRNSCGGATLEYRRMCSWLFDPKITFLSLTLAKLIAIHPKAVIGLLTRPYSFRSLETIARAYAPKDDDARRLLEVILPMGWDLHKDPDTDFKGPWHSWKTGTRGGF